MRLFRRRRPEASGTLERGEHSENADEYPVFVVGESRFPESFAAMWSAANEAERETDSLRRWAELLPVRDPTFGVAEVRVEVEGMPVGFLRPPHLDDVAALIDRENVVALRVPALIVRGPAGQTVTLRITLEE